MADDIYSTITSDDPRTGALTAAQLQARRQIAIALATRNRPYPKTIGEGLTALGEGLGEGYFNTQVARAEAAQTARDAALARPPSGTAPSLEPSVAPAVPRAPVGRTSMEDDPTQAMAYAAPSDTSEAQQPSAAVQPTQALPWTQIAQRPQMSPDEFAQRSARNETGAEKDPYRTVGKEVSRSGDRAYGKYQVMGENVPVWTKQYLGKEMTPQEFLLDDKAQDQLARARGGEYLAKYGPNGAAAAWFVGENGMQDQSRPNLQAHVANYVAKFNAPLVSRDQVAASAVAPSGGDRPIQLASLGGMPTSDTPPDAAPSPARDAVAQSLVAQQQPPPPPSQQVAQAQQVPTAQQMPISPPRIGPQVPAFPAYGDEPKMPPPTKDMIHYRRAAADPYASDAARATFKDLYDRMEADQKAEFGRKYELWKAKNLEELKHNVTLPQQQEGLTRTYQQNLAGPQSIITSGQQGGAPQAQPQAGPDPRLGTKDSPQRTGIPTLPQKPDNMSQQQWSELQGPEASKAVQAVQAAAPQFEDAIKTLQLVRNHPGKEYGLGAAGIIARQIPQTDAYAFDLINKQISGKNFMTAYPTLKGGGAISNVEGDKAQIAQARVDPKQAPKDYYAAVNDFEHQLRRDFETAQRKVNMPVTAWRAPGDNSSYAPDIGQRKGDHEYVGGNPSDPASWKKVQ